MRGLSPVPWLTLALALSFGCGGSSGRPIDVLLVTLDTTRADHLSVSGYPRATTPFLEELAANAARFDVAYSTTSTTGPSHASLFTSLYPPTHGVVKNGLELAGQHRTLAEVLGEHGYQTAAFVSSYVLGSRFGYSQGFGWYDDVFTVEQSTMPRERWAGVEVEGGFDRRADLTTRRALAWLETERDPSRPLFLWVHYFDPHSPYGPPGELADRFGASSGDSLENLIRRYDAEIAFVDQQLRRLTAAVGQATTDREVLTVVTADHGEGLMDHGHMEHGVHLYEEATRVPLLFHWPGRIENALFEEPADLLDVAPTILGLVTGRELETAMRGRNLAPSLLGALPAGPARPVFLFRRHYDVGDPTPGSVRGTKVGIRMGNWKYIEGEEEGTRELYDLRADPREANNLADELPERVAALSDLLAAWKESTVAVTSPELELSDEVRRKLEALGYVQ